MSKKKFSEFGLDEQLLEALGYMNFVEATPIQERTLPHILANKDLIACAQTGTGKTAAFILPVLHKLANKNLDHTDTLVICPTRELALQIDKQIQGFAYFLGITSKSIYGGGGGAEFEQEKKALTKGANIIVATPGKLISHLNLGYVKFDKVSHLILDEADRMLDMGFQEDLNKIISYLPKKRQSLLFSATMPPKIRKLAKEILHNPEEVSIAISKPAAGVLQAVYVCYDEQKNRLLHNLISDKPSYESILIFSSTKAKVSSIIRDLRKFKYDVAGISSDFDQKEREQVLSKFRSKKIRILVATDVLSRGIDIKDINLVINYDVPKNAEDYVHRIGRTARANTTGVAISLVNEEDVRKFITIEKLIEKEVMKLPLPEFLGKGPEYVVQKFKGNHRGKPKHHSKNRKGGNNRNRPNKRR